MKYFTEEEVQEFKDRSLNFPFIVIEKEQHEVVEITEVVSMSGGNKNNGIPTGIEMHVYRKGEITQKLIYQLMN